MENDTLLRESPSHPAQDAMSRIADLTTQLEEAGLEVRWGTPATKKQVAALEAAVGCKFPKDYVSFLEKHGAVAVGDRVNVYGHAPEDDELSIIATTETVMAEFEEWGHEPTPVAAFFGTQHFPSDCTVFEPKGAVQTFRRGSLEDADQSFEDIVVDALEFELTDQGETTENEAFGSDVLQRLATLIPKELQLTPNVDPSTRLLLRRPTDGVDIELRFGDSREYCGKTRGLFVFWTEPQSSSLSEMNDYNRRAVFVRGTVQEGRNRYRGCVPVTNLDLSRFLQALANDAALPLTTPASGPALTLDEVESTLVTLTKDEQASSLPRVGDTLVVRSPGGVMNDAETQIDLQVSVVVGAFVRVSHRIESDLSQNDLLTIANHANGAEMPDDDVNFDMERMIRCVVDRSAATFSFVMTVEGITSGAYAWCGHELETAIGKSGAAKEPDKGELRAPILERFLGLPAGPVSRALLRAVPSGRVSLEFHVQQPKWGPPETVTTPWGPVVPFIEVQDADIAGYARVKVGVVASDAKTIDDCRVVGILGDEAALLAPDLKSFVSVVVLGVSGFSPSCNDERARRIYCDLCSEEADLGSHFFEDGRRLCRDIGITPARSVTAVLEQVGSPRRAKVTHAGT